MKSTLKNYNKNTDAYIDEIEYSSALYKLWDKPDSRNMAVQAAGWLVMLYVLPLVLTLTFLNELDLFIWFFCFYYFGGIYYVVLCVLSVLYGLLSKTKEAVKNAAVYGLVMTVSILPLLFIIFMYMGPDLGAYAFETIAAIFVISFVSSVIGMLIRKH